MSSLASFRLPASLRFPALALLVTLLTACAHGGTPTAYPAFDHATAQPRLVVTKLLATGGLPAFPQCKSPDVLCMDPAPTWMKLRTIETVHGAPMPDTFFASTTSHYGPIDYAGPVRKPMLMLLLTQAGDAVMLRYARALLEEDSTGERHLVLTHPGPYWLPCSVAALREPITDPVLARAGAVSQEHYHQFYSEDRGAFFTVEGDQAVPRYSLPITRLGPHLAGKPLSSEDFACDSTQR
jgi:hypothetical protein